MTHGSTTPEEWRSRSRLFLGRVSPTKKAKRFILFNKIFSLQFGLPKELQKAKNMREKGRNVSEYSSK